MNIAKIMLPIGLLLVNCAEPSKEKVPSEELVTVDLIQQNPERYVDQNIQLHGIIEQSSGCDDGMSGTCLTSFGISSTDRKFYVDLIVEGKKIEEIKGIKIEEEVTVSGMLKGPLEGRTAHLSLIVKESDLPIQPLKPIPESKPSTDITLHISECR